MVDIQILAKRVWLQVLPEEELSLQKDFENIISLLAKLDDLDVSWISLWNDSVMEFSDFWSQEQQMDHNIFFANMKHEIRNGQMLIKHKGKSE